MSNQEDAQTADTQLPKFSRYKILSTLGKGGMGAVYKAKHLTLERMVALKVPALELAKIEGFLERFAREGKALARLEHPNVVRVYDAGIENETPYIAMAYIDGRDLSEWINDNRVFKLAEVVSIGIQMAKALQYAHQNEILHRDIKSSNVLLTKDGKAVLTDFGIARINTMQTMTNGAIGTPAYMSPEQIMNRAVDSRSDLYSLGLVLYEVLTHERAAFEKDPRRARTEVDDFLAEIIIKCLNKKPGERFQTGADLATELEKWPLTKKNSDKSAAVTPTRAKPIDKTVVEVVESKKKDSAPAANHESSAKEKPVPKVKPKAKDVPAVKNDNQYPAYEDQTDGIFDIVGKKTNPTDQSKEQKKNKLGTKENTSNSSWLPKIGALIVVALIALYFLLPFANQSGTINTANDSTITNQNSGLENGQQGNIAFIPSYPEKIETLVNLNTAQEIAQYLGNNQRNYSFGRRDDMQNTSQCYVLIFGGNDNALVDILGPERTDGSRINLTTGELEPDPNSFVRQKPSVWVFLLPN